VDADELRLCYYRGGCRMVAIGEMGATMKEGTMIVVGGED